MEYATPETEALFFKRLYFTCETPSHPNVNNHLGHTLPQHHVTSHVCLTVRLVSCYCLER